MADTPGTDIVFARASLRDRMDWAKAIAAAGDLVPKGFRNEDGSPNAAKVLLAAEYAAMLGEHPLVGLTGINVIEGKPIPSPALMSALIRKAGHKLRVKTTGTVEGGDFAATATLIRADDPGNPYTATWTPQRAARAGLCTYTQDPKTGVWHVNARSKWGKPLPWENFTEDLCKRRAISEVGRDGAEDALLGAHYTAEEVGAIVNEHGEIIREDLLDVIDGEIVEDTGEIVPTRGQQGKNEDRGHAKETRVDSAPAAEATPDGASRPGPSRPPKAAGRPTTEPITYRSGQPTGDDWLADIMATQDVEALRHLWARITEAHAANLPTRAGMTVAEAKDARKEALQEAGELPPALDGLDEEPV